MTGPIVRRRSAIAGILVVVSFSLATCSAAWADEPDARQPVIGGPQTDVRWGGVLDESYHYHRQIGVASAAAPPCGWYGYGFPVQTYRWGWFGAEHYYPWVFWHRGYNGESVRWAYRRGY